MQSLIVLVLSVTVALGTKYEVPGIGISGRTPTPTPTPVKDESEDDRQPRAYVMPGLGHSGRVRPVPTTTPKLEDELVIEETPEEVVRQPRAYVMPGLGHTGRIRPVPMTTEPPCDSCCEPAPPVDKDKMTCDALDKKYIMLEKNMEDECSAVDTDDGDDGMCDQLTFEVVPKCMEQEKMDAEECFERVGEELEDVGVMEKCKCRAYKKIKEDFLVTMELFCDNEGRDGKNQCLTPLAQVVWWNYLTCATAQPLGQLGCIYFLRNQQCFTTWAANPRPVHTTFWRPFSGNRIINFLAWKSILGL